MALADIPEWVLILIVSLLPLVVWLLWANFFREEWDPDCPVDVMLYFLAALVMCPVIWVLSLLVTL